MSDAVTEITDLRGKVALVTGGTRGIGRGIALKLAQAGCDVIVNFLEREDSAHEVVSWVRGMGRRGHAIKADVSNEAQVAAMFREISEQFGRINILVNNVGPFLLRPLSKMTSDEWHTMLNGNLSSAWYVSKMAAELMQKSEAGGSMIFVGSPNSERIGSQSESPAYSIAKTGVTVLALTWARDLAVKNIRVNVVNPGFIENDSMTHRMREWMPHEVPLGRVGTPANVADAVLFLASDKASYVTGTVVNVHGGLWV